VAVSPDGAHLYVTNQSDNAVTVINTATNNVTETVAVGALPFGVAVSPDGAHAYVTNTYGNTVSVIDTNSSSPTYNTVTVTIPVGTYPYGVAVSPDSSLVYVTNGNNYTVSVISTATNTVTETVAVGIIPAGVGVSPDGSRIYVTNSLAATVSVISNVFSWRWPDLVGELLGGVAVGGGGWLVIGDHFYKIPPRPLAMAIIARAAAPHLGSRIENRELAEQLRNLLS